MSTLFALSALSALSAGLQARAQNLTPLSDKHYTWPDIPYQVTGDQGGERGPQAGFNLCNSTTESQTSMCQTAFLNNPADWCMWSSNLNGSTDTIGESEAREVAWCTAPGHGTRIIPPGAITGMQWLYAKTYVQVVGYIDQTKVGIAASDQGGELDPHGADEQGNPLGGIVFSNGFGSSSADFQNLVKSANGNFTQNTTYTQVIEWIDFLGGGVFCMKMCDPASSDAPLKCQHIYDEVGCTYNAIADYNHINGTFSVCDSDDMADPGIFTTDGQVTTWHQPFSGTFSIPYQTTIPASSNCVTYSSEQLFAAAATDTAAGFTVTDSAGHTTAGTGTAGGAQSTGSGANGGNSSAGVRSGADVLPFVVVGLVTVFGTVVAMLA